VKHLRYESYPFRRLFTRTFRRASRLRATTPSPKERLLFQKLDATIHETDRALDGILGVYILDLVTGTTLASNADELFPTASTIKIAILAELFHQAQLGKLNLNDSYTLQSSDLVAAAASLLRSLPAQQNSLSATSPPS